MINVAVTQPDLQKFIEEQIRSGLYDSPDQVVAAGLSLLQHDPDANLTPQEIDTLRSEISIGLKQADNKQFSAFTAEDIIAEGMKKLNLNNGN